MTDVRVCVRMRSQRKQSVNTKIQIDFTINVNGHDLADHFFQAFPPCLRPCTACPLKQFQNSLGSLPSITRAMGTSAPRPCSVRYCTANFIASRFSALLAPFPIHTNTDPPPSKMNASLLSSLLLSSLPEHTSLHSITPLASLTCCRLRV